MQFNKVQSSWLFGYLAILLTNAAAILGVVLAIRYNAPYSLANVLGSCLDLQMCAMI